jgi:hypothetical protein
VSSILQREDFRRVRLVKIDVGGYEVEVLRGLEDLFDAGARPAVLVEVHVESAAEMSAFLETVCAAYELKAYVLVDDDELDRLSPRMEALVELSFPLTFASLPAKAQHQLSPSTSLTTGRQTSCRAASGEAEQALSLRNWLEP